MRGEREGGGCRRRGEAGSWGQRGRSERSSERVQRERGRGRQWTTAGRCGQGEPGVSEGREPEDESTLNWCQHTSADIGCYYEYQMNMCTYYHNNT